MKPTNLVFSLLLAAISASSAATHLAAGALLSES
jgi:TRAP-type C4-dicarboxylate transport system permease large subunit